MDRASVVNTYNEAYATAYNERYLLSPWAKHGVDFEVEIIREHIGDGPWLDVGCGTGWVLSQFPEVERAGLDLSPDMLNQARAANPGVDFTQGDFTHDIEAFHHRWSLVTCMWMAYCYLESMPEVEALVANMARWTAPGGSAFIPSVIDLEDLRPHVQVPYEDYPEVWGGRIAVTGYNWTWEEPGGNVNENMMAVHVGHFVRLLEPHFEKVEVVQYPIFQPGYVSRKAVLASGRRPVGETGEAEVIWHPVPRHPDDVAAEEAQRAEAERHAAALAAVAAEEARLAEVEALARAEAEEAIHVETQRELAVLRHENAWLRDTYLQQLPPLPDGRVDLSGTSTRRLAGEVARRLDPRRPEVRRAIRRRLPGGR